MRKKIVVFGATGNLGVYLVDWFLEKFPQDEYEVIAVSRRKTNFFESRGVRYFSMDVSDKAAFEKLPQDNVYAAVHLANILPARVTEENAQEYFDINVNGTINVLEYLRKTKADRIVFTQTYADIAGHWENNLVYKSDFSRSLKFTGDHALYAISKCAAQDVIQYYHETYGIKNFILRLPNIYLYSPEKYYFVDGVKTVISYRYIIERAINGEPIEIWGNPNRVRDMVYVKDFCQLVEKTLLAEVSGGVYNVGTGVGTSLKEQIEGIIKVFSPQNAPSEIVYRPDKKDAMEYIMDIENAKRELGYEPKYFYEDYLKDYKKEMTAGRFDGL